jgi:hypothetical protein
VRISIRANAQQEAAYEADQKKKHKSDFTGDYGDGRETGDTGNTPGFAAGGLVGHFAEGGSVESAPAIARLREVVSRFATGGMVSIPPLDLGLPDMRSPALGADGSSVFKSAPGGDGVSVPHHIVDLRTDHGTFRMMSPEETVRQLNTAAIGAKTFSTGKKPSWVGPS